MSLPVEIDMESDHLILKIWVHLSEKLTLYDETNADGSRKYAIKEICEMMGISRSSLYRYLGQREAVMSSKAGVI
jgi:predicted transcriptional regulator YheO